ncbi:MAG: hypothetical protein MZW92_60365 [Comamonadaceae bacterium]|nr:hypothetical protein [Comamonadaceae bacterium]
MLIITHKFREVIGILRRRHRAAPRPARGERRAVARHDAATQLAGWMMGVPTRRETAARPCAGDRAPARGRAGHAAPAHRRRSSVAGDRRRARRCDGLRPGGARRARSSAWPASRATASAS